ncbi:MAG TPA: beta-L-arabinofuranosidase domain-containing protein [Chitinophagaceae bacterium]|nr:beta-L-arabinofuranosidase domain-containing protein [Chitinophagaceae bacterium]
MKKILSLFIVLGICSRMFAQTPMEKFEFVNFSQVNITDDFWKPKIDKVATVTMNACIYQTEVKTPRIRNFEKVARNDGEKFEGLYYDDSDVYKALEAMAYALKTHPDSTLEAKADVWIDKIAAAQLPDGYLDTYFTLTDISKRWTNISAHEDYNAGHLIEAAVAYYNVTGKRKLLDVAIRLANHIDSTFRLGNKKWFSGHEEIELALVKLYKVTKNDRYLKLADWYLQQRGKGGIYTYGTTWFTPGYWQDLKPVKDQTEITGHAVRAMYLYTGAADVAAQTGDAGYMNAMEKVWEDVVYRNMYITGGIGSAGDNEGFSKDYDLPNEEAYCETCASVGMVLWNQRMCQLTGDSKYIDVLERSLYNGALDGLSLSGDHFFYDNVLASNGQNQRREWFGTACCPANIARLVTSVGNYIYGKSDDGIWVNLFVGSNTTINVNNTDVAVKTTTNYPWEGNVKLNIDPSKKTKFKMYVRIPGWFSGNAVPGNLYNVVNKGNEKNPVFKLNGKQVFYAIENGYAVIDNNWNKGDVLEFNFTMESEKIQANSEVKYDAGRIALQRGPIVYCVEGADNKEGVWNLIFPGNTSLKPIEYKVLNENVIALQGEFSSAIPNEKGDGVSIVNRKVTAIPYYCWANRGANAMQVWLPTKIKEVKINYQSKYEDGGNY